MRTWSCVFAIHINSYEKMMSVLYPYNTYDPRFNIIWDYHISRIHYCSIMYAQHTTFNHPLQIYICSLAARRSSLAWSVYYVEPTTDNLPPCSATLP